MARPGQLAWLHCGLTGVRCADSLEGRVNTCHGARLSARFTRVSGPSQRGPGKLGPHREGTMPPRENPTARQARLGAELRKLRELAGKTAREAAGLLSTDQAKISHIESGRIGVSEERIRRLAVFYACDDGELIDALCVIARESRGQGWWDEYRGVLAPGFLNIAELEHHATYLRSVQSMNVPGVLQTEDYVRAIHSSYTPALPADELEVRVEFRKRRRRIFEREAPPPFNAVVHEAALRMRFGGRKITKRQLEFLLEASEWPTVTVRVIPFTCENFIEATYPLMYVGGVVAATGHGPDGQTWRRRPVALTPQLKKFGRLIDIAERSSLSEQESRQLIHQIEKKCERSRLPIQWQKSSFSGVPGRELRRTRPRTRARSSYARATPRTSSSPPPRHDSAPSSRPSSPSSRGSEGPVAHAFLRWTAPGSTPGWYGLHGFLSCQP